MQAHYPFLNDRPSTLTSRRCTLRAIHKADLAPLRELYSNPLTRKYLGGPRNPEHFEKDFTAFFQTHSQSPYWIIETQSTGAFIGEVSLGLHHNGKEVEISYQLHPEQWGKGLASEAIQTVLEYAFTQCKLSSVLAETQTQNRASCRLLEKLGFSLRETLQRFEAEQSLYCKPTPIQCASF